MEGVYFFKYAAALHIKYKMQPCIFRNITAEEVNDAK